MPDVRGRRAGWEWLLAAAGVLTLAALALAVVGPMLVGSTDPTVQAWIYDGYDDGDSARELGLSSGPGVLGLFAVVAGFLGEYGRRASVSVEETPGFRGGTVRVRNRPVPFRVHGVFLAVAFAAWALVVLPPAMSQAAHVLDVNRAHTTQYWTMVGINAFIAAAIAGAVGGSLFKKMSFVRHGRRRKARGTMKRPSAPARRFWRFFSHRWRLDTWTCALGMGTLGVSPLIAVNGSVPAGIVVALCGACITVVGALLVSKAWKSGVSIYELESIV